MWTTKFEKLSEMCIVQHVETKFVFTFQPIKLLFSTTVKNAKPLNNPFKDPKPRNMLFGGDGTHFFARKTSCDYEKGKLFPFLKNFLRQSQPSTSELESKKVQMSPNMESMYPFPIG